jgi:hypothetical protein
MRVNGFMNVQIVEQYSNLKREIVVSIVLMERFPARRFSLLTTREVAVRLRVAVGLVNSFRYANWLVVADAGRIKTRPSL